MSSNQSEDDWITLGLMLTGAMGLGLFSFGTFLRPLQIWALDHGLVVPAAQALVPIGSEIGLSFWQAVICGFALVGLLVLFFVPLGVRRRRAAARG